MTNPLLTYDDLYDDFEKYQKALSSFFYNNDERYTSEKSHVITSLDADVKISKNTFYDSRRDFKKGYCTFTHRAPSEKNDLISQLYFERLQIYLFNLSTWSDEKCLPQDNVLDLRVTSTFLLYYLSIISSYHKRKNWYTLKSNILDISSSLYGAASDKYITATTPQEANLLFEYWLNIVFPDKLYELILMIQNIIDKESGYMTQNALRYNLTLYICGVSRSSFRTILAQDKFLDDITVQLEEYFSKRKEKCSIGEELFTSLPPYLEQEDKLYLSFCNSNNIHTHSTI